MATTSGTLTSLYPALIITLSNISPHLTQLTITSSARLTSLLTSFSSPLFLLADESHPRLVYFVLEVFNNVIMRHLQENPNLIYALLRARNVIEALSVFTLRGAVRDVRRREEAAKGQGKGKGKIVGGVGRDSPDLSKEKRDLIQRERGTDLPTPEDLESGLGGDDIPAPAAGMSEKARGKLREDAGREESLDLSAEEEVAAAVALGKNGFVPTQEWVSSWQRG